MSDNIDENEIRKAIDKLQLEHPVHFAYDATRIVEPGIAKAVQDDIDRVAKMMVKDATIHIICEMAKLYLDGVKPTVEPKRSHREWIPCSERLPEETGAYLVTIDYGDGLSCAAVRYFWDEKRLWNEAEEYITAWMPIPKPYKEEGEKE